MQSKEFFIGIDVSKATLDFALHGTREHIQVANGSEGFKRVEAWLESLNIIMPKCWFIFEFTGGYEYKLVQFCSAKGITFTRVPGLEIKKSLGMQRGKNDKIDSKRIAAYGYEKREKIKSSTPESADILTIKQFLTQRDAFVKDKMAAEHRAKEMQAMMELPDTDPLISNYLLAVDFAKKMIDKIEESIAAIISANAELALNYKLLVSIPGIGPVNAWTTIAFTENFKRFADARKYGAYCGVVPFEHTSGTSIRKKSRVNHMANKEIKAKLDNAARAAITYDKEMQLYYQRRIEMGKHHNSIKNEVKFKLVTRMFAVVKKQKVYVDNFKKAA